MEQRRIVRTTGWVLLAIGAVAAVGALVMRDQIERHRRELFSSHPLRRLAALGYLGGVEPSVESVRLLRDFLAWEPRPLLRKRAALILARMERRLLEAAAARGGAAG